VPDVALIVALPTPAPVARPVALIVATVVADELHVALFVRFCCVPSLNVPVAVNCCVAPFAMDGAAGVMTIDCSVAAVPVNVAVFDVTLFNVAVMFVEPTPVTVARPPAAIVAAAVFDEVQATCVVRFCVVPSLNVPIALYCCVWPFATVAVVGVMAIDCSVAAVPVNVAMFDVTLFNVAVMFVEPTPVTVARPVAAIVAVAAFEDAQATCIVRFCVVLSLNVPTALYCCV
jgi:hypothetical protein